MEVIEYPFARINGNSPQHHGSFEGPIFVLDSLIDLCYKSPSLTAEFIVFSTVSDPQPIYEFGIALLDAFDFTANPETEKQRVMNSMNPAKPRSGRHWMVLGSNDHLRIETCIRGKTVSLRFAQNEAKMSDRRIIHLTSEAEVPRLYISANREYIRIVTPEDFTLSKINPTLRLLISYCNICCCSGRKMLAFNCGHLICLTCHQMIINCNAQKKDLECIMCKKQQSDPLCKVVYRETFCPFDKCNGSRVDDNTKRILQPCCCLVPCQPPPNLKKCPYEFCNEDVKSTDRIVYATSNDSLSN